MHKHLFPALMQVYDTWVTRGGREAIEEMVPASEAHWDALADRALEIYRKDPGAFAATLKALFESRKFQNLD